MIGFNLTGYLIYALVTSITPDPNNFMLFSHGKEHGFKNVKMMMLGIFCGFVVLLYAAGYGMAEIVTHNATIGLVLKIVSSIWLFYLGIVLSNLSPEMNAQATVKIGFVKAFLMQFINPKAWIMAIGGAAAFLPHYSSIHLSVFVFTMLFAMMGVPCMFVWIGFGDLISQLLKSERANRIMGYLLLGLMMVSILMVWL
jgi:threonine/homoserine/homoserine lactone efflux protein